MRTRSGLTPELLDRERERRTLDALVADLHSGRGCALVVRGEAGVGKSALLEYAVGLEAERSGAGAPPAAGRLSSGFAGLDVIAGRILGRAAVHLLPDVVKVISLAQGRYYRH